jgi:hypothetical protein
MGSLKPMAPFCPCLVAPFCRRRQPAAVTVPAAAQRERAGGCALASRGGCCHHDTLCYFLLSLLQLLFTEPNGPLPMCERGVTAPQWQYKVAQDTPHHLYVKGRPTATKDCSSAKVRNIKQLLGYDGTFIEILIIESAEGNLL